MKYTIPAATAAVGLGLLGAIVVPTAAQAHTPQVTSTCSSITANLTNYETRPGTAPTFKTVVVTPAVAYQAAVYGDAPLITPATEGTAEVPAVIVDGVEVTPLIPAVPATDAVYGERPLISAEVAAVAEVTEQVLVTPGTSGEDNTITLVLDGVVTDTIHFGTSYSGTKDIDGTKNHTYSVKIDAIGTQYDTTINGKTTACVVPVQEIPYPTLLGNDICGPDNDTTYDDQAWLAKWGPFVDGPWKDGKWKTNADGKRVVDGSANIKAEFRKTYIWAGTGKTSASDFTRWRMYPGTAPFVYADAATECPVVTPPVVVPPTSTIEAGPTVVDECGTANDVVTYGTGTNGTWSKSEALIGDGVIKHRVVFTPDAGYTLPASGSWDKIVGGKAVWDLTTTDVACPVVTPPAQPEVPGDTEPVDTTPDLATPGEQTPDATPAAIAVVPDLPAAPEGTKKVAAEVESLAYTGIDARQALTIGGGLLVFGALAALVGAFRRRTAE